MNERKFTLPLTEPCPIGWHKASVVSEDTVEECWINPENIDAGKPYSTLTPEQIERLRKCQWLLKNVDPRPFDQWLYNFSCDTNPEHEIRVQEAIAKAFKRLTTQRHHTKQQKQQLWHFLLAASVQHTMAAIISAYPKYKGQYYEDAFAVLRQTAEECGALMTPESEREQIDRIRERVLGEVNDHD